MLQVKCNAMDNTSDAVDTAAEAPVEDLSEKLKVGFLLIYFKFKPATEWYVDRICGLPCFLV